MGLKNFNVKLSHFSGHHVLLKAETSSREGPMVPLPKFRSHCKGGIIVDVVIYIVYVFYPLHLHPALENKILDTCLPENGCIIGMRTRK